MEWTERRPNIRKKTLAWEASWQRDFDQNSRWMAQCPPDTFALFTPLSLRRRLGDDQALLHLHRETGSLCRSQYKLALEAARRSREADFDEGWKALSVRQRQDYILEGLVRTMSIPDMEERRKSCPESTVKSLNSEGGAGYLRLFHLLKAGDPIAEASEPILVPNAVADRFVASVKTLREPGVSMMLRSHNVSRALCLTTLVWNIFLAYHGKAGSQHITGLRAQGPKSSDPMFSEHGELFRWKAAAESCNAFRRALPNGCFKCRKTTNMLPSGTIWRGCSKCSQIGRKVVYCSRDCQIDDWKNGLPRPHKQICGKPLTEDVLQQEPEVAVASPRAPSSAPWIPSADPSFKRSPALLLQVHGLAQSKEINYVIASPCDNGAPDIGFRIPEENGRLLEFFLEHRDQALRTGDALAVGAMYIIMCSFLVASGLSELCATLRKQLKAEFGVALREWYGGDLIGVDFHLPSSTEDELE